MIHPSPSRDTSALPEGVRASLRAKRVAEILDVDITTVYRLIKTGELEAFRVGPDYRIFVDSLSDFQAGTRVQTPKNTQKQPQRRPQATTAHRESVAFLRRLGVCPNLP